MNRPAPVEVSYKSMRFLITHNPTNATLSTFIEVSGAWLGVPYAARESLGMGRGAVQPSIVALVLGPRSGEPGVSWGAPCREACGAGRLGQGLRAACTEAGSEVQEPRAWPPRTASVAGAALGWLLASVRGLTRKEEAGVPL